MPARQAFYLHPQPFWRIFKLHLFVGGWRVICTQKTTLGANSRLPPRGFQGLSSGHQTECVFCKLFYSAALVEWSRFQWISPIGLQSDLGYWIIRIFTALRWEGKRSDVVLSESKWNNEQVGKLSGNFWNGKSELPFRSNNKNEGRIVFSLYREWRNQCSPSSCTIFIESDGTSALRSPLRVPTPSSVLLILKSCSVNST